MTISGNNQSNVLSNQGAALLEGVTLTGGFQNGGSGGALASTGPMTIRSVIVSGNTASDGGGIYTFGNMTILNSTITNNVALSSENSRGGGGIQNQMGDW